MAGVARKVERVSLYERLSPDTTSEKLVILVALMLLEVILVASKLAIRLAAVKHASSDDVNTMLFIDTLKYGVLGLRNCLVLHWVVQKHRNGSNGTAFERKNIIHDTVLGAQSEIALEVLLFFAIGAILQTMSFDQLVDGGTCGFVTAAGDNTQTLTSWDLHIDISSLDQEHCVNQCVVPGTTAPYSAGDVGPCRGSKTELIATKVWAGAAYGGTAAGFLVYVSQFIQFINYLSLVVLFAPFDNSDQEIKTFAQMLQVGMYIELGYDIALHMIYSTGDSQGLAGTKSAASAGSTSFHDLRIASLVAFISARIIAARFFSFKSRHPRFLYCEQLHAKVPGLSGDYDDSLVASNANVDPDTTNVTEA